MADTRGPGGPALRAWLRESLPASGNARRLGVLTLIQSLGLGVFLTSSAVFFTRTIGIPAQRVGLALSVAGLCGLLCTVPIGRLADRLGAGRVLTANFLLASAGFTAYCMVDGFAGFLAVACAIAVLETSAGALQASLTHALVGEEERVRVSAQMRSLFNLGFLGGAALAGAAIAVGTSTALYATVLTNAALQLVSVAVLSGMRRRARGAEDPEQVSEERTDGGASTAGGESTGVLRSSALRDTRYVAIALVCGALELYHPLLTVGLPLWIVTSTDAPALTVSGLLILDTVLVLLFQVRVSRGAQTPAGAARMLRWAGWSLGASCLVFALSAGHGTLLDSAALLGGALVLVLGELYQASAGWGLSFGLAPPGRQGEYQAVFSLGRGLQQFAGPWLMTSLIVGAAVTGWVVLAALFVLLGLAGPPLVRGLEKSRARTEPVPS
ncbi:MULTISPECIES: MFS transporter [unclassified Streptomyces]|uniref:MFS transporter n=1 Tax=unclassified Streptomyces TaxID=2593676 RepID=UPI002E81E6C5|nr:MFS transporter [Streptomyces sp. NBC_00589]WTI34958.1 MFS transporter [Streptomyces sp. NBC_00775]WUB31368.1 MFS transporter [Streptomyces sp. NBC_00589]